MNNEAYKGSKKGGTRTIENPENEIREDLEDIEKVPCVYDNSKTCIKCKICKNTSGTLLEIQHRYTCKYNQYNPENKSSLKKTVPKIEPDREGENSQPKINLDDEIIDDLIKKIDEKTMSGPFVYGTYEHGKEIDREKSVGILQREYAIISKYNEKTIIGTFGAGPCYILCMRNRENTYTIIAHIDVLTLNPLDEFKKKFKPNTSDVYIVGGDNSSKKWVKKTLEELKENKYKIKFAHIIDDKVINFAINCVTGEVFINKTINPKIDLPLVYNIEERNSIFESLGLIPSKSNLSRVYIKDERLEGLYDDIEFLNSEKKK